MFVRYFDMAKNYFLFYEKLENFENFSFLLSFTSGLEINFVCLIKCIYLVNQIVLILDKIKKALQVFVVYQIKSLIGLFLLPTVPRLLFLAAVTNVTLKIQMS